MDKPVGEMDAIELSREAAFRNVEDGYPEIRRRFPEGLAVDLIGAGQAEFAAAQPLLIVIATVFTHPGRVLKRGPQRIIRCARMCGQIFDPATCPQRGETGQHTVLAGPVDQGSIRSVERDHENPCGHDVSPGATIQGPKIRPSMPGRISPSLLIAVPPIVNSDHDAEVVSNAFAMSTSTHPGR